MDYANTRVRNVADPGLFEFASEATAASHQCLRWNIQFTRIQVTGVYNLLSISLALFLRNVESYVSFSRLFFSFLVVSDGASSKCPHSSPSVPNRWELTQTWRSTWWPSSTEVRALLDVSQAG
jgi:hypothetical protein